METFSIDYEKLDVETIMTQIRQRVEEKKGMLYTDAQLEHLASLKLPSPLPPSGLPTDPPVSLQQAKQMNAAIAYEDLLRSAPGFKGKVIHLIRKVMSKLFRLVMNVEILVLQHNRHTSINNVLIDTAADARRDIDRLTEQHEYKLAGLRGLIEGQRHQIEYLQARLRALEELAVLKEAETQRQQHKTTEIPRGRYSPGEKQ